jgi:hypothetical protein
MYVMPCGYHINLEDGLVTISAEAELDLAQLHTLGQQVLADPAFDPYLPQLVDLRGLNILHEQDSLHGQQTAEASRNFALSSYRPRVQSSVAVIIDESLDADSIASLFHLSCSMDKTELFDHYDQAIKWLMRREFA